MNAEQQRELFIKEKIVPICIRAENLMRESVEPQQIIDTVRPLVKSAIDTLDEQQVRAMVEISLTNKVGELAQHWIFMGKIADKLQGK